MCVLTNKLGRSLFEFDLFISGSSRRAECLTPPPLSHYAVTCESNFQNNLVFLNFGLGSSRCLLCSFFSVELINSRNQLGSSKAMANRKCFLGIDKKIDY